MEWLRFVNRTLDFIISTHDAISVEVQKPHGNRVAEGLRTGVRTSARGAMTGIGAGLAAYAVAKYAFGADEQTANNALVVAAGVGALYGMFRGYTRHGTDRPYMESFKNILRPASSYVKYCRGYGLRFA